MSGNIKLENVSKTFERTDGSLLTVLDNANLDIRDGEFVSVIGPSGSGKSTLLYIVAGLEPPTSGLVTVGDNEVRGPHRERGVVFQEDAIFPWRTVLKNVEYGLELRQLPKTDRTARARRYISLVGLEGFEDSYPKELSGGMKKRVAIATVLANDPAAILLDEPFGALDYVTTLGLQDELATIWEQEKKTVLNVTHDVEEAVFLSERVVVLRDGSITYEQPVTFPRPRRHELRNDPEFIRVKEKLWREIAPPSAPQPSEVALP